MKKGPVLIKAVSDHDRIGNREQIIRSIIDHCLIYNKNKILIIERLFFLLNLKLI